MKLLNKTFFLTVLIATFALGQPVLADTPDHNEAAQGMSVSQDKHHANKDAIFYSEGDASGRASGSHSDAHSSPKFSSAENQAIKQLIFGNAAQDK